ncbi:4-diphosphocytidyl-2-C-methyl-D-erythritol kinase [uncultured Clostridium sp.]|uniref:4-diphosphocytidyl-2-C-methyl-D-erythritol kinase n=1 Tax=Muricoprocola aceti TaxID=2981772 RepID=A0ABT2SLR1_9FIRM|nr:4-(cytidine 5'-diphospho)-2-C-methyl-D-erythritol kinase [Muricoprocola aceti]MCU6725028.1 4-(cytidine 5'-diphospho)-2-C-methyl-D-erythritol kinase [Muricoprocola aceti]SCH36155.1 4-diphosphocytidyl-2-C-methyl-D-erythritol kinase [uncultured Clostridium sp.]
MRELKLKAKAKINLGLDVVRKREDGYHEVRMIMQMINLYDMITLRKKTEPGITVTANLSYLPVNEDNLVYRAAKLLMDEFQVDGGLEIELQKYIPVAAGMAGGSTDAAAVMVGVNRIFQLGLNKKQLMERGVKIGADVPFCIMRGTALAEGIGEELTPLPAMPHCSLVIAKPKIHVSTKFVYGNLKVGELTEHPDIDGQVQALRENNLEQLVTRMGNVLETVTIPAYPVIDEIKHTMMKYGAMGAMMSGSGPTVFGIFEKEDKAQEVCRLLKKEKAAKQVYLVRQ